MMYWNRAIKRLNWPIIFNLLGYVLLATGCFMLLPMIVSIIYHETCWKAFLYTILLCVFMSLPFMKISSQKKSYFAKDGMIAVGLSWFIVSIFGALPFYFSREIPSFIDVYLKQYLDLLQQDPLY